jgi:hypothetical protein
LVERDVVNPSAFVFRGAHLKEAANINTSLMVLGRCLEILRKNQGITDKTKWA